MKNSENTLPTNFVQF